MDMTNSILYTIDHNQVVRCTIIQKKGRIKILRLEDGTKKRIASNRHLFKDENHAKHLLH